LLARRPGLVGGRLAGVQPGGGRREVVSERGGAHGIHHKHHDPTINCLSGPHREPYSLGHEEERAAERRDHLAPPTAGLEASQPAPDQARPPREQWRVEI
ncbi:hypothetical protein PUR59_00860, partial [Streptomyces sp. SP18ES09]|uniref:hypothetical protein n=1 Tax=Streptomyces sp. SP18ES09 TaxID=3002532 RepID=UPI002E761479